MHFDGLWGKLQDGLQDGFHCHSVEIGLPRRVVSGAIGLREFRSVFLHLLDIPISDLGEAVQEFKLGHIANHLVGLSFALVKHVILIKLVARNILTFMDWSGKDFLELAASLA